MINEVNLFLTVKSSTVRGKKRSKGHFNPFTVPKKDPIKSNSKPRELDTRGVSLSTLHHMCAIRSRECWNLWNNGYPIARVVDHYPSGDNYKIILGQEYEFTINPNDKLSEIKSIFAGKLNQNDLVIFLIDLLRLEKLGLKGNFSISLDKRDYGFYKNIVSYRLVLIPELSDIADNKITETDLIKIAKLAAKICMPDKTKNISNCKSIISILSTIENFEIRSSKKDDNGHWIVGKGRLFIDLNQNPIPIFIDLNGSKYRLIANSHGYWVWLEHKGKITGMKIPIQIKTDSDDSLIYPLLQRSLIWQEKPKLWDNGKYNSSIRSIVGTLAAEDKHAQNSCFHYNLEESDLQKGTATITVERVDGNANAHDLWEIGVRNREMEVALNSSSQVFEWKQDEIWKLTRVYENEPFKLSIKSNKKGVKLSDSGFLKLASIPQRSLMSRKNKLIKNGIRKEAIFNLMSIQEEEANLQNWRLSKKSNIMALQGPPGTGKTWTAKHIVKDILEQNPCARILVSSKEHLALDHLATEIRGALDDTFDIVRINNSDTDLETDVNPRVLPKSITEKILNEITLPKEAMKEVGRIATWVENLALRTASVVCTTTLDRTMENLQNSGICFDFAIIEEAGKSYPSELIGPMSISMKTLLIGDHLQLPPFELLEIQRTIEESINLGLDRWEDKSFRDNIERYLIDIIASKSNRGGIDIKKISSDIEEWLQPFELIHKVTNGDILSKQWRMFKDLSDSVGSIFYTKPFQIEKVDKFKENQLPGIFGKHQQRLILLDVADSLESNKYKSYCNKGEAKVAAKHLKELLDLNSNAILITPYKGQVDEIRSILPKNYRDNVKTVDGYQGKEADFIILSLVRNNKRTGSSRRWGFFRDPRRINVALSRAKEGLLVISSVDHIENTDWAEGEGQLSKFVKMINKNGKIITGGGKNE